MGTMHMTGEIRFFRRVAKTTKRTTQGKIYKLYRYSYKHYSDKWIGADDQGDNITPSIKNTDYWIEVDDPDGGICRSYSDKVDYIEEPELETKTEESKMLEIKQNVTLINGTPSDTRTKEQFIAMIQVEQGELAELKALDISSKAILADVGRLNENIKILIAELDRVHYAEG